MKPAPLFVSALVLTMGGRQNIALALGDDHMDIEGAGGVVTGGLIAGAIEKPTGKAGEDHAHGVCSDCGAPTSGTFCANCGQPTHVHRTLLHLGDELLHGVMHFDARVWRTLPLLWLNPGKLTREWVEGGGPAMSRRWPSSCSPCS